jgi:hypothetical protein
MIPEAMLFQKPIDLRHICLFYLGHIPAFQDIYLSRLFNEPHTEPVYFKVSPTLQIYFSQILTFFRLGYLRGLLTYLYFPL